MLRLNDPRRPPFTVRGACLLAALTSWVAPATLRHLSHASGTFPCHSPCHLSIVTWPTAPLLPLANPQVKEDVLPFCRLDPATRMFFVPSPAHEQPPRLVVSTCGAAGEPACPALGDGLGEQAGRLPGQPGEHLQSQPAVPCSARLPPMPCSAAPKQGRRRPARGLLHTRAHRRGGPGERRPDTCSLWQYCPCMAALFLRACACLRRARMPCYVPLKLPCPALSSMPRCRRCCPRR